uniref:Ribonuclease A-domain domain-containing protein n=1 Tax=Pelusios castaneus TaxID=367368 RepID=A0A8C8VJ97_9SAUR
MALRRPCPMFLLPLILLAVGLSLGSGQTCVMKNRIFQRHHVQYPVIFPRPKNYCDKIMRMRQIYGKPLNTFIHAPIQAINRVCSVSVQCRRGTLVLPLTLLCPIHTRHLPLGIRCIV